MLRLVSSLAVVAVASAVQLPVSVIDTVLEPVLDAPVVHQKLVDAVNSHPTAEWKASLDQGPFFANATVRHAKVLMGTLLDGQGPKLPVKTEWDVDVSALPANFDSRKQWPSCANIIGNIRDQSACGSCWAFGAVEAMSDRECIKNGKQLELSAADMMECCSSCGYGCSGGYPAAAFQYAVTAGIVDTACSPYPFPSCAHHVTPPPGMKKCPSQEYPTPQCNTVCNNTETWSSALHRFASANTASGEQAMMQEIYTNGPVETAFTVYQDFVTYKSGVYTHVSGPALGGHAVKIIGWGVTPTGTKYWRINNSWNKYWGDNGEFLIKRGVNECGIEDEIAFGQPQ